MAAEGPLETQTVDTRLEFAQGDILRFDAMDRAGHDIDLGVIINADCDIQNDKLGGFISYLPIYPIDAYFDSFWAPKHINSIMADSLGQIGGSCNLTPQETLDLREWLSNDDFERVANLLCTRLGLKKGVEAQVRKLLLRVSLCLSSHKPITKLAKLSKLEVNAHGYLKKQLTAGRKAIQEGGFFLNEIVGEGRLGFVIRLCRVLSIPVERCFKCGSDRLGRGDDSRSGVRIAQLTPPYKYRVAQLFAYQFSRIGLPDEVTALEAISLHELADDLIAETET